MRKGAYNKPIPDGECGEYIADEGGEASCVRRLDHAGPHSYDYRMKGK
jgi:hypothetical protein